jgi:pSer/pThr/pTyr-binding forkhead associated (FHA) protein
MNLRLVVERGRRRIWTAEIRGPEGTIGRALGSTVRIPSSEVSRLHCRLRSEGGLITVEDLESVNGTFLNGQRVRNVMTVRPGDRLTVGPVTFVVEYELTPDAMNRLRGEDDVVVLEADDEGEVQVLEEIPEEPYPVQARKARARPPDEVEVVEADADDLLVFDTDDVNLPAGGGGDLRDILLELDETGDQADDE